MNGVFPIRGDTSQQQTDTEFAVIGQGEYVYACFHDWLSPPEFLRFGDTQGLAQDSAGRIYVGHTVHPNSPTTDAIAVFDESG